jgi:hypothetical protein
LSKITGGAGHGGGTVISSGSTQYQAFEQYFLLLDGGTIEFSRSRNIC